MAIIEVEATVSLPAAQVWDAVADLGNVHVRLLPGRVAAVRLDGDTRVLTMPDGSEITEKIFTVDPATYLLAYGVVGGQRMPLTSHHASFQVFADGAERSRLVWTTEITPDAMAGAVRARVERGIAEMKQVLEA